MLVRVYNVGEEEVFSYHLPLLLGEVEGVLEDGSVEVTVSHPRHPSHTLTWPLIEGCFKVLVPLQPGRNEVKVRYHGDTLTLHLNLELRRLPLFVRPVYLLCADSDGQFQGPEGCDCSLESAVARIRLAAQLIQTLTAEKLKEHGFGRVTFDLELDKNGRPMCHVFRSRLTTEQAYAMTGNQLWSHVARELMTSSEFTERDRCKWYCFLSCTRYFPPPPGELPRTHAEILKHTRGHTALGGGGLALFGTGNLHTWASCLEEIYPAFTDCRKVDRRLLMDDSAYREYYWANYATGLGASLHELGHTFDLAHTASGVMARGFDDLHKVFTVQRLRSGGRGSRSRSASSSLSRSSSASSLEEPPTLPPGLDPYRRRYADVCYGSPFRRVSRSNSREPVYIAPPPLVVRVETGFQAVRSPSALTLSVRNYDGTCTQQTIVQNEPRVPQVSPSQESASDPQAAATHDGHVQGSAQSAGHVQSSGQDRGHARSNAQSSGHVQSSGQESRHVQSSGQESRHVQSSGQESRHVQNSVQESRHVQSSGQESRHVQSSGQESRHVQNSVQESRHVRNSVQESRHVQNSVQESRHVQSSVQESRHVQNSVEESRHVQSSVQESRHVQNSVEASIYVQSSARGPEHGRGSAQDDGHVQSSVRDRGDAQSRAEGATRVPSAVLLDGGQGQTGAWGKSQGPDGAAAALGDLSIAAEASPRPQRAGGERRSSSVSSVGSASSVSPCSSTPSTLPNSPDEPDVDLRLPEVFFADGGAHWARSSAVVLRFHRWFNKPSPHDPKKAPVLAGLHIKSPCGLRLVELRSDPENSVFHHWEFLAETPPTDFALRRSKLRNLPENAASFSVIAEDSYGNILKKRIKVKDLE